MANWIVGQPTRRDSARMKLAERGMEKVVKVDG